MNIPDVWPGGIFTEAAWQERRQHIIQLLCAEEYGFLPPDPVRLTGETTATEHDFCAGKAPLRKILLHIALTNGKIFTLPISVVIPAGAAKIPFFVHISFSPFVPDKYMPSEEIADNGFGMVSFYYEDLTADNGDFSSGLAGALDLADNSHCGKIALWAWAAMRALDYALTLPELDANRAAVIGHSRLGKTALLAGALDTRFAYVISNNSGCGGAALSRNKKGERIQNITDAFPYWFKAGFERYANNETAMPFDQHFLLAAAAPRRVYAASADNDEWADPKAEFLSCMLAGEVWTKLGLKGLVCAADSPAAGTPYHEGQAAYHIRNGEHYLGREDWRLFMQYIQRHS